MLDLRLLGGLEARIGDHVLAFPTRHAALLLAWLALSPDRAHPRERLAAFLWPDRSEEQARTSLRQALYRLRTTIENAEPFPLEIGTRTICLKAASLRLDLAEIEAAGPHDPDGLAEAVERAQGELLDGFESGDTDFDTWILAERSRVRRMVAERFGQLSALHEQARRFHEVEALARRQLALDPYDEAALRRLMSAAVRQGRRNAALAAFRAHSDRLRAELSVVPEAETVALWQTIRSGTLAAAQGTPAAARPAAGVAEPAEDLVVLAPPAEANEEHPPFPAERRPEKRHVAVLHLTTRLAGGGLDWDPEAAAESTSALRHRLEGIVQRHGGTPVPSSSGEVVALFGGVERPALPAARAAIEMGPGRGVAAGVHAGEALAGSGADLGPVALVARRLAEAGDSVTLSEAARLECDGYLHFAPGPPLSLPGLDTWLPTWRPTGSTGARNSWQARAGRGLSPFVGRMAELELLRRALGRSMAGATVAVITGEAGMGKSRLLHEVLSAPWSSGHKVIETGVAAYQTEAAHSALGTFLRSWAGLGPEPSVAATWDAVSERLHDLGAPDGLAAPLRMMLDLPSDDPDWSSLAAGQRRRRVAEALRTILDLEGQRQPVILVFEDAHWVDADTARILDLLVAGLGAARVLVLVTTRPEFQTGWGQYSFVRNIRLEGLDGDETERLLSGLPDLGPTSAEFSARLHERTGGVPLFIEEVVREVAERRAQTQPRAGGLPDAPPEEMGVPASIRGVLASRIDRLPAEQRLVLQTAAAIGPRVPESLLAPLADLPPDRLDEALEGLASAELLYRLQSHPEREYAFKHALTQDAAYRGLLLSRREELHRRLLALMEARHAGRLDEHVEDLARHARLGAVWDKAATYHVRAGERAIGRSAYARARVLFEHALDALAQLPLDEARQRAAIDIHIRLRAVLMMVGDYRRVYDALQAAEFLAEPLGDPRLLAEVRTHIAFFHATDGGFARGLEAAELALEGAGQLDDRILLAEAAMAKGQLLRMRGDYAGAMAAFEAHLDVWSGPNRLHRGINIGTRSVFAHGHLSVCRAYLGDRAGARAAVAVAREIAEETRRPVDLQFAFLHEGIVTELEGREADSIPLFETALGIARAAELPFFEDWILVELGEALLALGEVGRALELLTAACARPPERVVEQFGALAGAALGKAQVRSGQPEAAEVTLRGVLDYARRVGHRQLEQMSLRRLATALADRDPGSALSSIDEAVAVAEANGLGLGLAKCLTVRASVLSDLGRHDEAAAARMRAAALWRSLKLPR